MCVFICITHKLLVLHDRTSLFVAVSLWPLMQQICVHKTDNQLRHFSESLSGVNVYWLCHVVR